MPTLATALALMATGRSAAELSATASYTQPNGSIVVVEIPGVVTGSGYWFNKSVIDGPLTLTWNYNVDPNPTGNAVYNGQSTIKNSSAAAVVTRVTFEVGLCPTIVTNSTFGGTSNVKLVSNANGGAITCGGGNQLTGVLVNGMQTFTHFWCPFQMSSGGAGTAQTSMTFGQPIPAAPGPANVSSFGHFAHLTLTDGDTAIFTAYTVAKGDLSTVPQSNCPSDINGDGVIDKWDLVLLLLSFGDSGACLPADINGDGEVNAFDLGLIVGTWGACPE